MRQEGIFSFSYLAFQAYFMARKGDFPEIAIELMDVMWIADRLCQPSIDPDQI